MASLRYLGRGEFIPGVPARDLTAAEAEHFSAIVEEHRRNTGRALYGPPSPAVEPAAPEPAAKPAARKAPAPAEEGADD